MMVRAAQIRGRWRGLAASTGLALCVATAPSGALAQDDMIARIREAWVRRQESVQTASFQFTKTVTLTAGSRNGLPKPPGALDGDDPPSDEVIGFPDNFFLINGGKLAHRYFLPDTRAPNEPYRVWEAFNGVRVKHYDPPYGERAHGQGVLYGGNTLHDVNVAIWPILITYRPLHANGLALDLSTYKLSPQRHTLLGSECVLIEHFPDGRPGGMIQSLTIAPDKGFAVLRMAQSQIVGAGRPPAPWCQIDVSYTRDERFGWVPTAWSASLFFQGAGKLSEYYKIGIDEYELNQPVDDAQFDPPFPVGARVVDERDHTNSIQLAGGELRRITWDEIRRGATHEELMSSPPGTAGIKDHSHAVLLICSSAVLLVCFVLCSAWVRRRNR